MKKKWIGLFVRIVISAGLIIYFLNALARDEGGLTAALERFAWAFRSTSWQWLIPAIMLHLVGFSLTSLRWKILLAAQGAQVPFPRLFLSYFMASFFNTFLPSTIGGDVVRAYDSTRITGKGPQSVMVVIIERLTGFVALVLIAGVAFLTYLSIEAEQKSSMWLFLSLALVGIFGLIVAAHPRIARPILRLLDKLLPEKIMGVVEKSYAAVETYYKHPFFLAAAQCVSIVFQMNMILYYFLIAKALNQNPSFIDFAMKIPIMIFLLMTVPAINGLGVRTASFRELMKFPKEFALAGEFVDLGMRIGWGLFGGLVFLFHRHAKPKPDVGVRLE
ncbi:MAG: flippase-like domain-containing protein [Candidatus Aminicenantes bacterium]|nr:MAG: flippase-like domain-containing protein [Candidatus Aminicenantes bacterium]